VDRIEDPSGYVLVEYRIGERIEGFPVHWSSHASFSTKEEAVAEGLMKTALLTRAAQRKGHPVKGALT
jgi:hypothetical protein